jgi:cytochrome P450
LFCFIVFCLGRHPEVKQRLQQELDKVFGKDLTKPITSKDLDELQYCDAVIKEVHRISVGFMVPRMNAEEDEVGGFIWPERTSFQILYSAIMKRQDNWTSPEKFDPDRFYKIGESDKYLLEKQHAKNAFTLFGNGIRICPGRKLAMIELKSLLALIYRKYDIEPADMNAPLEYENVILFTICKKLMVKVKPRKFYEV